MFTSLALFVIAAFLTTDDEGILKIRAEKCLNTCEVSKVMTRQLCECVRVV